MIDKENIPEAIAEYLTDNSQHTIPSLPIYTDDLPTEPSECIAIALSGQAASTTYFGASGNVDSPLVTVLVRCVKYETGSLDCKRIRELLNGKVQIENLCIAPASTIISMGRDPSHRHLFRMNFRTIIKE